MGVKKLLPKQWHQVGEQFKDKGENLDELIKHDEWKAFAESRGITDHELTFIRQGYEGRPLQSESLYFEFPFGKEHKGKKLEDIPEKYLRWCVDKELSLIHI